MKAIILAGGKGMRLRPLTEELPKPMLPIDGKPIIEHQIELLKNYGISKTIISIGYLGEKIKNYLGDEFSGVKIEYAEEESPLGTGGAIKNCEEFIDETSLVIYGDIFTDMDLSKLIKFHNSKNGIATIVLHKTDHPWDSDLVEITEDSKIKRILGKPEKGESLPSKISKSSIYVFKREIFNNLLNKRHSFEDDILPNLVKEKSIYGYLTDEMIKDVGTLDRYEELR